MTRWSLCVTYESSINNLLTYFRGSVSSIPLNFERLSYRPEFQGPIEEQMKSVLQWDINSSEFLFFC